MRRILFAVTSNSEFLLLRGLIVLILVGGPIWQLNSDVLLSCGLLIAENLLAPLLAVLVFLPKFNKNGQKQRPVRGAELGGLVGAVGASVFNLTSLWKYYFLGGREAILAIEGRPVTPETPMNVLVSLLVALALWSFLTVVSALVGILGEKLLARKGASTGGE